MTEEVTEYKVMKFPAPWEYEYLKLMRLITNYGEDVDGERTGVGTKRVIGSMIRVDSVYRTFPALTIRRVAPRISVWETIMFLRGLTDTRFLEDKGIEIWKGNTRREFLDKNPELANLPEGDMGKGYGYQWRNFGGVDQVELMLDTLTKSQYDRRAIISAWNPGQVNQMALPPCHIDHQYTIETKMEHCGFKFLNSAFHMRSVDTVYGLPYNMMSYAFLNFAFANYLTHSRQEAILPGSMVFFGFDCHIYKNQLPMVKELLGREPQTAPGFHIDKQLQTFDDLMNLEWSDCRVTNYNPLPDIKNKPGMAV